ncbi:hypothetical protein ACNPON_12900 [Glutamicibacter sp. AGC13]
MDGRSRSYFYFLRGVSFRKLASISVWKEGGLDTRLVELVSEVVRRYVRDGINVTELMFPSCAFGDDDLENFAKFSECPDWPRSADGTIDSMSD